LHLFTELLAAAKDGLLISLAAAALHTELAALKKGGVYI